MFLPKLNLQHKLSLTAFPCVFQEAFTVLLQSLDVAHETILQQEGGLTTLCAALVSPLRDSKQFVVCIVNVGDSLGFVFSKHHGIREITTGSHDIESERDIRDAGGALGPVNGKDPELNNLTCSMTIVDPGDIVYLTTDGISDNFDPVVTKIAVPKRRHSDPEISSLAGDRDGCGGVDTSRRMISNDGRPEMSPHERHQYAVKEMERIIHEFELFTEEQCCAQELCGALLQHVLKLTDPKRKVLENPELYGKKLRSKDRKRRDSEIVSKMSRAPGKLDHATIVAYEVGNYHGNDDEDYEAESEDDMIDAPMVRRFSWTGVQSRAEDRMSRRVSQAQRVSGVQALASPPGAGEGTPVSPGRLPGVVEGQVAASPLSNNRMSWGEAQFVNGMSGSPYENRTRPLSIISFESAVWTILCTPVFIYPRAFVYH